MVLLIGFNGIVVGHNMVSKSTNAARVAIGGENELRQRIA